MDPGRPLEGTTQAPPEPQELKLKWAKVKVDVPLTTKMELRMIAKELGIRNATEVYRMAFADFIRNHRARGR
ncbi:MAG TPA: hypothetical protein VGN72_04950 [Tepidisphaeraceae bacterium]|jgi:hypothetical protein|nr:hypothetical protein [Tepidisphaeraceae bacterium]